MGLFVLVGRGGATGMSDLSAAEEAIMRQTFRATMLRAAEIIERITQDDVLEAQAQVLAAGVALEKVAKVDRALLAATHLRACADGKAKGRG
jgi:hypothetical protein